MKDSKKKVGKQKLEDRRSGKRTVADTVLGSATTINGMSGVFVGSAIMAGASAVKHTGHSGAVRAIGAATAALGVAGMYSGYRTVTRKD